MKSEVPADSAINALLANADFYDSHCISTPDTTDTALSYFITALANTPAWVSILMRLRNAVVKLLGLKDLGALAELDLAKPASTYVSGDRVGIFTVISNSPNEALLGDSDKHLDVVLSVYKHPSEQKGIQSISVTTVVHTHNMLGKIYMLPVTPMHKLIAPAILNRLVTKY